MDRTFKVSVFTFLLLSRSVYGYQGNPLRLYSPYESRTVNSYSGPFNPSYPYQPVSRSVSLPPQRELLHKQSAALPLPTDHQDPQNFTITDLLDSINEVSHKDDDHEHFKAVIRDFDYAPYANPHPMNYNYSPKPNDGPSQPGYNESPTAEPASQPHHSSPAKFSLFKPDLSSLMMPVTAKVSSKVSGLLALVLTLLTGSAPADLEVQGFKDIVINGILRPLLVAKGGIKSLISKLAIPVISLLLINLEVLITVWWLWDDCPAPKPAYVSEKPEYTANNSYR